MKRIPVFTDDPGWHGKRLQEAFLRRGYQVSFVSLKDCAFHLADSQAGVLIPEFENALPAAAFVRGVPGGTLQQVIVRLNILHALQMLGIKVYNDGRAVERTVDKAMTSFILHHHGINTPATWVCENRHLAHQIIEEQLNQSESLVIKPLFGSQGKGVRKLTKIDAKPLPMDAYVDGLYYLQKYIDSGEGEWHDYRVFVINHQPVATMARFGASWVNNVALGGRCEAVPNAGEVAELAVFASQALQMDYCGVDIIRGRDGRLNVLEVNSIPAWKGLQGVANVDIAQALVDDFLTKI